MNRNVMVVICLLILFLGVGCFNKSDDSTPLKPGTTLHYSGKGKAFGVGVNTTIGKYAELVIYSVNRSQIDNIAYELTGKNGLIGNGTVSLDSTGYHIEDIGLYENLSKKDVMSIKLQWNGKLESINLKNVDK